MSDESFKHPLGNIWGGPGGGHKGSLQRAATARTADRKTGQNVRRHDLDRSYASMIKQKKLGNICLLDHTNYAIWKEDYMKVLQGIMA